MAAGAKKWMIAGGRIPEKSTGYEPDNTSREELCILNASSGKAAVSITIFYEEKEPVGPHELEVEPQRVRHIRINDLIDPEPVPLGTPYALMVESDVAVVVQFTRIDTSSGATHFSMMMAHPIT